MAVCEMCGERSPEDCRCKFPSKVQPSTPWPRPEKQHRTIQDEEIEDMIQFLESCDTGNLIVMLRELLLLRKRVRNGAA